MLVVDIAESILILCSDEMDVAQSAVVASLLRFSVATRIVLVSSSSRDAVTTALGRCQ
jgi:hypothetical protein